MPALLTIDHLEVKYGDLIGVADVSLEVPKGSVVALLGSNGAGKSTLLKAMSGILYTEEGEIENGSIRFRDEDVHQLAPDELVRRGIVQVPEGRRVFPALTIEENLWLSASRTNPDAAVAIVEEIVAELTLQSIARRQVRLVLSSCSGRPWCTVRTQFACGSGRRCAFEIETTGTVANVSKTG